MEAFVLIFIFTIIILSFIIIIVKSGNKKQTEITSETKEHLENSAEIKTEEVALPVRTQEENINISDENNLVTFSTIFLVLGVMASIVLFIAGIASEYQTSVWVISSLVVLAVSLGNYYVLKVLANISISLKKMAK